MDAIHPGASTVALFSWREMKLRSSDKPKTKRLVNAFVVYVIPIPPSFISRDKSSAWRRCKDTSLYLYSKNVV